MTEVTRPRELNIKVVMGGNGGFAMYAEGEFDKGCTSGDEALEWFSGMIKARFGETPRRALDHESLLAQITESVVTAMASRQPPHQPPHQPTRPHLPPKVPAQHVPEPVYNGQHFAGHGDPGDLPNLVTKMREETEASAAEDEQYSVNNLTARLSGEMNKRIANSVVGIFATAALFKIWLMAANIS